MNFVFSDDVIFDSNDRPVRIQRVLTSLNAHELHILMVKPKNKGGCEGGWKDGVVQFSEDKIRSYWPNWLQEMSDGDMMMCRCETCCATDDLHAAMKAKRRKLVKEGTDKINAMRDGSAKNRRKIKLDIYKGQNLE